ncbi:MAG: hypothetical protein KDH20_22415, partial [Rhodocyclaceae bacterium]|nr:hypothetical protein [Rhodocyclaceae bacterium]
SATLDPSAAGAVSGSGVAVASGDGIVSATVTVTAAGFVHAMGVGALFVSIPLRASGGSIALGAAALSDGSVSVVLPVALYEVSEELRLIPVPAEDRTMVVI